MSRCCIPACIVALLAAALTLARGQEPGSASPENAAFVRRDYSFYDSGRYVYEQNCVTCHGLEGDGRGEMADSVGVKPRSFRSGLFKYRSTPWGKLPTTDDLLRTVRNGRTGTAMGMFTHLTNQQQRAVVEYLKFFSPKWRKPENHAAPIALPPQPQWFADEAQRDLRATAGKPLFQTICATCHGPKGDGKGPAAAGLKNDDGTPASPADLRLAHLRSGDEPIDIFRTLATGLNGTPMVSFADALSDAQKWDVIAYILTLRRDFNRPGTTRR